MRELRRFTRNVCALLVAAAMSASVATLPAQSAEFSESQKSEIEKIVRSYLLANPELFLEVQTELEKKLEEMQSARAKDAIEKNAKTIFRSETAPVAGNPDGDVTVVEFFDYNCGFCKRGFVDVAKLIEKDKNVRVVLKEFPIFGEASEDAARVALAAKKQGKYWEVHRALLKSKGRVDGALAMQEAKKLGLDLDKLKADMRSKDVDSEINDVKMLAQEMGINGTPHFLVGDRAIAGAPEDLLGQFETNIAELRKNGGCEFC